MWRGTDFGSLSPPPFLEDDDDLEERVLQDILDLQVFDKHCVHTAQSALILMLVIKHPILSFCDNLVD